MENNPQHGRTHDEQVTSQVKPETSSYNDTPSTSHQAISRKSLARKMNEVLIYFYAAIAVLLLARFIFSMVGARHVAPVVDFVYQLSYPLMLPFANMFGIIQSGPYRLEFEVFVALVIYAVIFFGVAKLIDIIFG